MIELYDLFWAKLSSINLNDEKLNQLKQLTRDKLVNPIQGDFPRWLKAYKDLPLVKSIEKNFNLDAITCKTRESDFSNKTLTSSMEQLIPWRKGPFEVFDCYIDAEWQSNMKWNRIQQSIPNLENKIILDVGCGNGYYMFRMLKQNPYLVMGIDPGLLQIMQFWSIEKYIQSGSAILPLALENMPKSLNCFDVVFSMGVLYHRKSPIHHIIELAGALKSKGKLIIETLIIDGNASSCLVPSGRYAQMRNVWFLPSVEMLSIMLERNGFKDIQCVDVSPTTINEQRSTQWMKFHSLEQFLNKNQTKTIEGHPLPKRATLLATKN